jgi:hypothetical protein
MTDTVPGASADDAFVREGFGHPTDPTLAADVWHGWSAVRSESPIFRTSTPERGAPATWYVTDYEHAREAMQLPGVFSSRFDSVTDLMIPGNLDPPEHTRYRQVVSRPFAPDAIRAREPSIRAFCTELIDGFAERGRCELLADFAFLYPTTILLRTMGLPVERRHEFVDWVHRWNRPGSEEDKVHVDHRIGETMLETFRASRANPRADIASLIAVAEVDGRPLTDEELVAIGRLLFIAGLDTVASTRLPALTQAGIPVLADNADGTQIDPGNQYVYETGIAGSQAPASLLNALPGGGSTPTKIAVVGLADPAVDSGVEGITSAAKDHNATVVDVERTPLTMTSFTSQAARIVRDKAQVVMVLDSTPNTILEVPALRIAGFTGLILGTYGAADDATLSKLNDPKYIAWRPARTATPTDPLGLAAMKAGSRRPRRRRPISGRATRRPTRSSSASASVRARVTPRR